LGGRQTGSHARSIRGNSELRTLNSELRATTLATHTTV
jgi:hypothetical protein